MAWVVDILVMPVNRCDVFSEVKQETVATTILCGRSMMCKRSGYRFA
jgi:hypothetical protein